MSDDSLNSDKSLLNEGGGPASDMADNNDDSHTLDEGGDFEDGHKEIEDEFLNHEDLPDNSNGDVRNGDTSGVPATSNYQAGVIEMSTLIATSDLSRSESMDLLNLSLHQVC